MAASGPTSHDHPPRPKRLDEVRARLRVKHCSLRTEQSQTEWVKRFILFHDKRHPAEMGASQVEAFLSSLATARNVAASTQNQALSASLFLYREVLHVELPWLDGITQAPTRTRGPPVPPGGAYSIDSV